MYYHTPLHVHRFGSDVGTPGINTTLTGGSVCIYTPTASPPTGSPDTPPTAVNTSGGYDAAGIDMVLRANATGQLILRCGLCVFVY